jgi:hypothetical protein
VTDRKLIEQLEAARPNELPTGFRPTLDDENGKPLADLGLLAKPPTLGNGPMAAHFLYKRREFITLLERRALPPTRC